MLYTFNEVAELQKMPLDYKISVAIEWIGKAFDTCENPALAFSGGKDSTALWHLIRTHFPEEAKRLHIIFGNTGVEYPESLKFARQLGKEWGGEMFHEVTAEKTEKEGLKYAAQQEVLEWLISTGKIGELLKADGKLKSTEALENAATPEMWEDFRRRKLVWPAGTAKSYFWCCDQYGYPLLGKAASKLQARRINIDCFLRFSQTASNDPKLKEYYEMLKVCKISQHCCTELKKKPSDKLCRELGIDCVFMGMMASESRRRLISFCDNGYLYKVKKDWSDNHYHCHPIAIWTDDDVWEYIHRFNCPYSPLYDIGYEDPETGEWVNIKRNGCLGCGTDIQFPHNHLSILRRTHPNQWRGIMKSGTGEQIKLLRQYRKGGQLSMLEFMSVEKTIDTHPCIFDSLDELDLPEGAILEYDSEVDAGEEADESTF